MRYNDFVYNLFSAGWQPDHFEEQDYQGTRLLWARLFPEIAKLEQELEETKREMGDAYLQLTQHHTEA